MNDGIKATIDDSYKIVIGDETHCMDSVTITLTKNNCTLENIEVNDTEQIVTNGIFTYNLLAKPELFALVKKLFLEFHWSPEQIAARLKLENYPIQISYKTIYQAIYA